MGALRIDGSTSQDNRLRLAECHAALSDEQRADMQLSAMSSALARPSCSAEAVSAPGRTLLCVANLASLRCSKAATGAYTVQGRLRFIFPLSIPLSRSLRSLEGLAQGCFCMQNPY